MDLVIGMLVALVGIAALAYAGGREKEKRDVINLLTNSSPAASVYSIIREISTHQHRKLGKRSHYDDRKRRDA